MKRVFLILAGIAGMVWMSSCAGSHKSCAAYAKHETPQTTTYSDVQ